MKGMWLNSLSFNIKQSDLAYELTGAEWVSGEICRDRTFG